MPVVTRAMTKKNEDVYEVAEILTTLRNSASTPPPPQEEVDLVSDSDNDSDYTPDADMDSGGDDSDSEYTPSEDEADEQDTREEIEIIAELKVKKALSHYRATGKMTKEFFQILQNAENGEYSDRFVKWLVSIPPVLSFMHFEDDPETEEELEADRTVRQALSGYAKGEKMPSEFFRILRKAQRGDYSSEFTKWLFSIPPVKRFLHH